MRVYEIQRTQTLPVSMEQAWAFFSSPANLPSITPPWLNLAVDGAPPERMFPGMVIRFRLTPFLGMPCSWVTEITQMDAPHYFVDEQRLGPFRFWHHQHHFRETDGGVEMSDTVTYSLKYGPLGTLVHGALVGKKLEAIFDFRQEVISRIF